MRLSSTAAARSHTHIFKINTRKRRRREKKKNAQNSLCFSLTIYLILGYRIRASEASILRQNVKLFHSLISFAQFNYLTKWVFEFVASDFDYSKWLLNSINFAALNHHYCRWLRELNKYRRMSMSIIYIFRICRKCELNK